MAQDQAQTSPALFAQYAPDAPRRPLPGGLLIRNAGISDLEGISRLSWQREGGTLTEATARAQRWLAARPDEHLMVVAQLEERIIGYAKASYVHPATDQPDDRPEGWHLSGVIVGEPFRRCGIGAELTRRRLQWIAGRADEVFYFANSTNRASIDLHEKFGFEEIGRNIRAPGVSFTGGIGILFRLRLR
jgi:ribosomal protein S18 acetylase RimI-like enzyme